MPSLPTDPTDRERIAEVLRAAYERRNVAFIDDSEINRELDLDTETALDLISLSLGAIGADRNAAANFPLRTYFPMEINPAIGPPLLLLDAIGLGRIARRLLRVPDESPGQKPVLTVRAFIALILELRADDARA